MALINSPNMAVATNKEATGCSKERLVGMRTLALDHVSAQKMKVGTAEAGTVDLGNLDSC